MHGAVVQTSKNDSFSRAVHNRADSAKGKKKLRPGPPEESENTDLIADCREKGWKTCCSLSRLDDAVPEARNSVIIT